jgi:hypothetical protein
VEVDLDRPRSRTSQAFTEYQGRVRELIRE